ncbi:adenylyltransferase/cytidyltransferase family protein [candidate division KSB1 bacterium]|nr:adenylyltransferase/cytidyltransferase family protein [candidate division KSB1 bacterium]
MTKKKVLASGCYDLLHAGHIAFFKTASRFGSLFVAVGSDENVRMLKGKAPWFSQNERVYIVNSIRYVEKAFIASGEGMLDFAPDLERIKPDIFVVNRDGHTPDKEALCKKFGIEYKVLDRIPEPGLAARASSSIKKELQFPYRICIAGGWMDQPWVSEIYPGSVVVAQLWPTIEFNDRSGMATSSRKVAVEMWGNKYPKGNPIDNARILFGAENPPGSKYISGSQDHIGLLNPGISRLYYKGGYWPEQIDSTRDKDICDWLSSVIYLIPLEPRPTGYDPLKEKNLAVEIIKELGDAGEQCWASILRQDVVGLGESMTKSFLAWKKMLPYTVPEYVMQEMQDKYFPNYCGAITSGSGGGYVVVASEKQIKGALRIKVRF